MVEACGAGSAAVCLSGIKDRNVDRLGRLRLLLAATTVLAAALSVAARSRAAAALGVVLGSIALGSVATASTSFIATAVVVSVGILRRTTRRSSSLSGLGSSGLLFSLFSGRERCYVERKEKIQKLKVDMGK